MRESDDGKAMRVITRRTVFHAVAAIGAAGVAGACSGDGGGPLPEPEPVARVTANPPDGAEDVGVKDQIELAVDRGTFTEVTLTNEAGKPIDGKFVDEKRGWRLKVRELGYGRTYTYRAAAVGTDDKQVEFTGSFTTVKPAHVVNARINPGDGAVVGVAMPISIRFTGPAPDRAAVERALKVTTEPEVEGSWGWLHDHQVDWRPREYWPADTEVHVVADLYGVDYGGGAYGQSDITVDFTIGRNQVVKVHTPDHELRVYRDDALVATYPASNGKDADPDLNTPNGTMIVMEKKPTAIFNNARYGYTNIKKKWAVRFSNHGEFIHENEENRANIGKKNTSHGCVNLFAKDAKAYYDSAIAGDPVEVTGSKAEMPTSSDVNDWLFDWATWQAMSAL